MQVVGEYVIIGLSRHGCGLIKILYLVIYDLAPSIVWLAPPIRMHCYH